MAQPDQGRKNRTLEAEYAKKFPSHRQRRGNLAADRVGYSGSIAAAASPTDSRASSARLRLTTASAT